MSEEQVTGQGNVLVADDDPAILRLVSAIVEKEGFTAVIARDGKEAYQILQSGKEFRAAVFDVVMPYIQGTELVKFMQSEKNLKLVPVIMMTAEQSPKLSSDSLSAGAVAFLPKPFTASQLKMMLQMLTNTKKKVL